MHGLLVIDKPAGWTSHDVVARVRRISGVKRVGHAGTLDPMATGVLPLGIGQGTRVLEYLGDAAKAYRATIRLGAATDTYDAEGRVVSTGEWRGVTEREVRRVLARFLGPIDQQAPAYSAIKQGGVPLHRLARSGRAVEAPVRRVVIHALGILEWRPPDLVVDVRCSKGTYVRSLAHDTGIALGCGAHLAALRRTVAEPFRVEDAVTLETWQEAVEDGSWPARLLPLDAALLDRPAVVLGAGDAARMGDGVAPALQMRAVAGALYRAYTPDGRLLAVLRAPDGDERWRAEKVFLSHPANTKTADNA